MENLNVIINDMKSALKTAQEERQKELKRDTYNNVHYYDGKINVLRNFIYRFEKL